MTQSWKDRYFDEKFQDLAEDIRGVRKEVKELRDEVSDLRGGIPRSDNKTLMKNIGIVVGTAGAIVAAAVLAFRSIFS